MKKVFSILKNEAGSILVVAVMVLALLTIIVFTAMRTSNVEVQISTNELLHQKYFFTAEAGIDHAMKLLEQPFVTANAPLVRTGATASWNFAFLGPDQLPGSSDDVAGTEDQQGVYEDGSIWIDNAFIGGVSYRITLWNNDESAATGTGAGGDFNTDQDSLIWIRSDAVGQRGGSSSVQVLLRGDTTGKSITGYSAQAGAGAGKNYNANDLNPITDFSRQL